MKEFTQKELKEIMSKKLDYEDAGMFLHCKDCLGELLKSIEYKTGMIAPRDGLSYEASSYPFKYPDKTVANIVVLWCKKCGKPVWDSRHMTHLF